MESKFQVAKNYNFIQDFQIEAYLDTKDTVNHWCVGQIVDIDDDRNQIKVHFEGWTPKYDEWIKKTSQRIAPFRRHTEGYTGQKRNAFRDFKINYTLHNLHLQKIKEIREKDFKYFETPLQLTQYIRGDLYFYIDSLISLFNNTQAEDLPAIAEFLREVFLLIIRWMDLFPQYLKNFNECLQHPQLFLVDYDAAISQCGSEFFSILEKCFGMCPRCLKFFQRFSTEILYDGEKQFASKDKMKSNGLMLSLFNAFGNLQGFDKILEFIKFEVKDQKGKSFKGCPFILTMKALRPFIRILEQAEKNFVLQFVQDVKQALFYRLDNLTENEIKELDKEILKETIEVLKSYIALVDPQTSNMTAEHYELNIAQKYLRCPFFEKRVRGINDLKDIFYKVTNATKSRQQIESQGLEYTKWLNVEKYAEWIVTNKIIDFIFIENPHVELIKRSWEILRLLTFVENSFTAEIVELMWSCCREKHEDIVRATFDLIQELSQVFPLERLAQMYQKISSIKESEYDEKTVQFLKHYTLNAIRNIKNNKKNDTKSTGTMTNFLRGKKDTKIDERQFYDLNKFWLIFQDSNKVTPKVKELAINSLIEILQENVEKEVKEQFILLSLENISKGDTFLNSIIFLRKILNTYPLDSQAKYRPGQSVQTVSQILNDIFKKFDVYDLIFQNTNTYLSQALLYKELKQSQLAATEKLQNVVIYGNVTHEEFIKVIMSFIEFVLTNSKVGLTFDHVQRMFYMFVTNAITEYETNAFFTLLTKENEQAKSRERRFLLDDKVRNEVFTKIFCNNQLLNCEKINYQGFQCFKKLFLIINEEEKSLEIQKEDRVAVNNLNSLQGIETLWIIAIQGQQIQVQVNCKDFLVDLYLRTKTKSNNQRKLITEQFTGKCLQYFKNSHDKVDHQLNCIRLIKTFISRFDGEHIVEEDMSMYDPKEIKPVQVTLSPDKLQNQVFIHPNQKIWQLKRKMADLFKLKLSEFYIKTKQGPLEEHIYDDQIKDYSIQQVHIQRFSLEEMEKEFPRYLIGYNQEYTNMFIELLQQGTEECKREVLSLLESLPINIEFKVYFIEYLNKQLQDSSLSEWEKLFKWDGSDLSATTYFLMTLEDSIIPKREIANQETLQQEAALKAEFCQKFIAKGGFMFLYSMVNNLSKDKLEKDTLRTKALTIIMRLIQHLFSQKQIQQFKASLSAQQIENLCLQALTIIDSFIKTVKQQQNQGIMLQEERFTRPLKNDYLLLNYSFTFLIKAMSSFQSSVQVLYSFTGVEQLFKSALIDIEYENIQRIAMNPIYELSLKLEQSQVLQIKPSFFFMKMFIQDCLEYALAQGGIKTRIFFEILNKILSGTEIYQQLHLIKPIDQLVSSLYKMIVERQIIEMSARDEDVPLSGLFIFLKSILDRFPEVRENFQEKNSLLQYLIHDCLFHKETKGQLIQKFKAMPPKCKNNVTRENCLKLIHSLSLQNEEGMYILIRYLKNYIGETFWRTPRRADWYISVHQQERSLTGFVGMRNIGCICYMNSIMQQLFMIPPFKKALLEVEDSQLGVVPQEENVLHQLKLIFGGLMEVEKQYYNPKKFCQAFKDIDGNPIDPIVQKDVDEFFNMLMDRIENSIKGKKEEKIIKNLFEGVFANEFICKGCPHYSEREEPFLAISLQVKNKHSIKESLDSFVEGEMLEGDNAYYCEKCEKKVSTLKRCCIKRMPNVLILVLKRFEFNYDTMTKFKINDYCEFPMSINMNEYSQENLTKKDLLKQMEEKNLTLQDMNEDQKIILEKQIPSKYYEYNLKGTVIHIGTAEQGHYYSFIQDRENANGKWYEFNDTIVKDFDPKDIPHEAFGGEDESVLYNLQNMGQNDPAMVQAMKQFKTKIKNAYILIYEREDQIDMEKFNEFMDDPNICTNKQEMQYKYELCKLPKTTSSQIQIPPIVHDNILEKNKKFWLSKFIFNKTYIDSVLNIFKEIQIKEDLDYTKAREIDIQTIEGGQLEMFKFLASFFLTTVIRAKDRKSVPSFMKIIREALKKNVAFSVWLIETFNNQDLIKELLVDCPIHDMKRFVAGLIGTAMQTIYKFEEKQIQDYSMLSEQEQLQYIRSTQQQFIKQERIVDSRQQPSKGESYNSSCKELILISLKHHNIQIPSLLMMINSFIHLSISQYNIKNQPLCGQFYMVFSHFSELGEYSRLYLLKTKSVGRLLDLFFNLDGNKQALLVSQKFRDESLTNIPLIVIDKDLYIKTNLEKNDIVISSLERKAILQNVTNPNIFLIYTISNLVRSCIFVKIQKNGPLANGDLNYLLEQDEIQMLINHSHENWWQNCDMKIARNAIALMFAHISYENKEFSMPYLTTLLSNIQKATFDKLKYFERPLLKMVQIQDSYQVDRIKKVITSLQDIMKLTTMYYKDMDSLVELVYKFASRTQMVAEMLNKNPQFFRFIEQWQKDNLHFPINQTKTRIFRQGILQWNNLKPNIINQTTIDKVANYSKERLQKLWKIIQKDQPTLENSYDSDDEMYHHGFQEKERVDFMDNQETWHTGSIDIALDEMIKCVSDNIQTQNGNPATLWIETESDKLAPPNTQTANEKRKMHQFYLTLLKNINPQ